MGKKCKLLFFQNLLSMEVEPTENLGNYLWLVALRFVGKFIPRSQRLKEMGDAARKFTNVFVKNFGEELDEEKLKVIRFEKLILMLVVI